MPTQPLNLYAIFHLNLAYSSIEEEQRATVVERCYWPLLRLAEEHSLPFGIEATAYTLEVAAEADPSWLAKLRELIANGTCELVGAGYSQLIGPLVPPEVNSANLRIGNAEYERLVGVKPRVALANEQAYSAGLVGHYLDAGHEALFMEWDNPALYHREWDPQMRYLPQVAVGQQGRRIELVWNLSTAFQKFQRYAHGDLELDEYVDYLRSHAGEERRAFSLYGNDIEIFDFRPGRFEAEPDIEHSEWERIGELFAALAEDPAFAFISPSAVLAMRDEPGAGTALHLESPELPVPVKKQGKYNLTRWAVTGRDDIGINTRCWRAYEVLRDRWADDAAWRELCYLWSSDFRTHITVNRWEAYLERLAAFEGRIGLGVPSSVGIEIASDVGGALPQGVTREGRYLTIETPKLNARLNARRGLAIDALAFASTGEKPLVGTLEHGYYDDINMTADYYTGHVVLERVGQHKIADLSQVEPVVRDEGDAIVVEAEVPTPLGPIRKRLSFSRGVEEVTLEYDIDWTNLPKGSLRLGHVTLMPDAFDPATLYYATHNGGAQLERFPLAGHVVDQGAPVSLQVTASTGIGVTGGVVELGDANHALRIEVDKTAAALVGLVAYREVAGSFFCRLSLSVLEVDETRREDAVPMLPRPIRMRICPA